MSALEAATASRCRSAAGAAEPKLRRVRVCYFNVWARELEDAARYAARAPSTDLSARVTDAGDAALLRKARLDCDWYGENVRCFAAMQHEAIDFLPAWVCGPAGLLELARTGGEAAEERWLIVMGHQPAMLRDAAGKLFALLARSGVRVLFYAFDEASRFMAGFAEIAPHFDVLIHDEAPLEERAAAALRPGCVRRHRSWVANVVPFAAPFNEAPEDKIIFLGSRLGLTSHRQRQIDFLRARFRDRFVAICDHSLAVGDRFSLNRFGVSVCPEGRKFATPAMSQTHTDRPFWSGCLGLVPVSEDSRAGGRLEELHRSNLIVRYPHGDLDALAMACERALATSAAERRRIYEHFNRRETVGTVVAGAIASAG